MFNGQGKYYMEFKGVSGTKIAYGISDFKSSELLIDYKEVKIDTVASMQIVMLITTEVIFIIAAVQQEQVMIVLLHPI